jgi:fructoselysine 6-phosphate deglycase
VAPETDTATFNPAAMAAALATAAAGLSDAMAFGRSLGPAIDRVHLVACGSSNRAMLGLQYWIERLSPSLEVRRYFPAEYVAQEPRRLDQRTLVLLASKSGTTPETVAAADYLRTRPCRTVAFTQVAQSPLACAAGTRYLTGATSESFIAVYMLMQSLVGGLLAAKDGWPDADPLLASLAALPDVIAASASANDARAAAEAERLRNDRVLYHVASGPGFTTAYVFGVCVLMEMLWLHSYPIEAAEFFHGPFEIVDGTTPLILLLGEDPSRPLMERVVRFCRRYSNRLIVYDSRDFAMPGIAPAIRPMVAPYVLQAALKRIAAHLSVWHRQPLGTRRYMWKTEY